MESRGELTPAQNRAAGALIGTFVGDALGMPVEGWSSRRIEQKYGELDELLEARMGRGTYTDDTQMMIATAKSLLRYPEVNREDLAESFLDHYDSRRGYGRGTSMVFQKWRDGITVDTAAEQIFDGGSFGNGGSMRIAPVGVLHAGSPEALLEAVRKACGVTHAHPLGIGCSYLQAYSVGKAFRSDPCEPIDPLSWVDDLSDRLPQSLDLGGRIVQKLSLLKSPLSKSKTVPSPGEVAKVLGCSSQAFESVPTAIAAFLINPENFEDAVTYAVGIGGDTDTIAAMTGAIAGAYHGVGRVPDDWWEALENGKDGRDEVIDLGLELAELQQTIGDDRT